MPDRVIVANLAEDFSAEHASKDVEEFFFVGESQSSRTLSPLELLLDVIADLSEHTLQSPAYLFFRVVEIDAGQ